MNVLSMVAAQQKLDAFIIDNKKITEDLVLNTVVALEIELSEMANEKRWFKHWSEKRHEAKEGLLSEVADVMHFYFSLSLQKHWIDHLSKTAKIKKMSYEDANKAYLECKMYLFQAFKEVNQKEDSVIYFACSWEWFLSFVVNFCGFTYEELENAYWTKHDINIARQSEGY